jgi:predicted dehydrogenase
MLGYQRRFWAIYRRMREEVQSGRWGKIVGVTAVNTERWQQTIAGTWRDNPDINYGGFLGDAGSHRLDGLFYVTGLQLVELSARSSKAGSSVEIVTLINGELQDGQDRDVPFSLSFVGNSNTFHEELFIHCEKADLIVRDFQLFIGRNNEVELIELPPEQSGRESTQNPVAGFLDLLTGKAANISPFECALPVFDMTTAILESARSRSTISSDRLPVL